MLSSFNHLHLLSSTLFLRKHSSSDDFIRPDVSAFRGFRIDHWWRL